MEDHATQTRCGSSKYVQGQIMRLATKALHNLGLPVPPGSQVAQNAPAAYQLARHSLLAIGTNSKQSKKCSSLPWPLTRDPFPSLPEHKKTLSGWQTISYSNLNVFSICIFSLWFFKTPQKWGQLPISHIPVSYPQNKVTPAGYSINVALSMQPELQDAAFFLNEKEERCKNNQITPDCHI